MTSQPGQHRGGEHVVRQAVGQLGTHICGGRGDHHQVRAVGQGDVLHLVGEVPVKGIHHTAIAGELLKGEGGDEFGGVLGEDHFHRAVLLHQGGGQSGRLIGGNAAGDPQQDGFPFQHDDEILLLAGWTQNFDTRIMTQIRPVVKELVHIRKVLENLSLAIPWDFRYNKPDKRAWFPPSPS